MSLFQSRFRIESTRFCQWDYHHPGWYFVTICTKNRTHYFGSIIHGQMILSKVGIIARDELLKTPTIRNNVIIDEWVIMPNHIHLIIHILPATNGTTENVKKNGTMANGTTKPVETHRGASLPAVERPATGTFHGGTFHAGKNHFGPQSDNLPAIVRGFKSAVKRDTNKYGLKFHWQPRYHDHIIRDDNALSRIKMYIRKNIESWYKDSQNR